jgi:amino acid transporter
MLFSFVLLIVIAYLSYRIAPREREEHAKVHGAGQIGLLGALALFGVDYFTSFFYASGEMLQALHPYGMEHLAYISVALIALANGIFGFLYMYSLGIFSQGGGSYTASMRYLSPGLSLVVAVLLIQDYIFTIVVSSLSGVDQLLSIQNATGIHWVWHFLIGAVLVSITYYLTIRGRGESAQVVFMMLGVFVLLTLTMAVGLFDAHFSGLPKLQAAVTVPPVSIGTALYHMLTATMKGLVALTGLEAVSDGIQFIIDEDAEIIKWGKRRLPRFKKVWDFYSGKAGVGRMVQTSFLFYGGLTTFFLTSFAIRFGAYDEVLGRSLVGNLAFIGFNQLPGGIVLFWVYQFLAVVLLAAASMTAFQDLQATAWRDVAIGEIPEVVVYRNPQGTFTRSVTAGFVISLVIMLLVRGETSQAIPYYGIGVFMPFTVMALSIRQHVLRNFKGRARRLANLTTSFTAVLAAVIFVGQIIGKWTEGGWVVLITFSVLVLAANALLLSPIGYRDPNQIHRIVREKARVQGAMASIVEWQSLRMQEYRYSIVQRAAIQTARFFDLFGVRRPVRYEPPPIPAGEYDDALHIDHPEAPSLLADYLEKPEPKLGGAPKETGPEE